MCIRDSCVTIKLVDNKEINIGDSKCFKVYDTSEKRCCLERFGGCDANCYTYYGNCDDITCNENKASQLGNFQDNCCNPSKEDEDCAMVCTNYPQNSYKGNERLQRSQGACGRLPGFDLQNEYDWEFVE